MFGKGGGGSESCFKFYFMQLSFTPYSVNSFFSCYRFCILLLLCMFSFFRLSGQNPALTLSGTTTPNTVCSGEPNGSISLVANGGDGNYSFFIYDRDGNLLPSHFSNLRDGNYLTAVEDGSGNRTEATFYVTFDPQYFNVAMTPLPPKCTFGEDGKIELDIMDQSGAWTSPDNFYFQWWRGLPVEGILLQGEQMPFLYGIGEGIYSVVVTDNITGCSLRHTVEVFSQPNFSISTTEADLGNNGTINITLRDGTREYTFSWADDPGITTKDRSNLVPGDYTVKILDVAANCEETLTITVGGVACTYPQVEGVISDALCNNEGAINLSVSGGEAPYSYSWNNGAQTEDISGLAAGTYSVTVTTAFGCQVFADFVVNGSSVPVINSYTVTEVSCLEKGSFEVVASGGLAPYSMKVTGYGGLDVVVEGTSLGNLEKDCYSVQVLDGNGCSSAVEMICVSNLVYPVNLSAVKTDAGCYGKSDGTIDLSVSSFGEPFIYEWSNGATTEDLQGLPAGTYEVTVTSSHGCTGVLSVTIAQPAVFAAEVVATSASCKGVADGSVITSTAGGVAPYTYAWTKEADAAFHSAAENPAGLSAGTYFLTVTDAAGCETLASVAVGEPEGLSLNANVTAVSCFGRNDGSARLTVSGGTAPYTFEWSHGATAQEAGGLAAGTYEVRVRDASGCTESLSVVVTEPAALTVNLSSTSISCNAAGNGSVVSAVEGGVEPYTYSWSQQGDTDFLSAEKDLSSLLPGIYFLKVSDAAGCEVSASAEISEPSLPELTADVSQASCADSKDGSIDITVTGGTAPYVYSWNTGELTEDREALREGTYTITVEDANGCLKEATYTIKGQDDTAPVAKAQNVVLYLDKEGKAVLTPEQLNDGSSDNCLIASFSLSRTTFDCRDAGLDTEVELTVADAALNSSSVVAVVSVRDTIAPVVQAHDLSLVLGGEESITISAEELGLITSDACGVGNSSLSQYTFDESDAGENSVIVSVTDIHGNTGRRTVSVIVEKPTGLFSHERISSVKVYPVPFKDELYFETEQIIYGAELELTDALGHVVVRTDLSNISGQKLQARIETDNWKPGVYFYRILQNREYIASGKLLLFNGGK